MTKQPDLSHETTIAAGRRVLSIEARALADFSETLGEPFKMFDFAPVGGIAAIAGLAFVSLIGWRIQAAKQKCHYPAMLILLLLQKERNRHRIS